MRHMCHRAEKDQTNVENEGSILIKSTFSHNSTKSTIFRVVAMNNNASESRLDIIVGAVDEMVAGVMISVCKMEKRRKSN